MVVHSLLKILEENVRQNSFWKVVSQMGDVKNKRVEVCNQPGFWMFNKEGLLEEHTHPGTDREGQRTEQWEQYR